MPSNQYQALIDCGCDCGVCDSTCCPGAEPPDTSPGVFLYDEYGQGSLGCPELNIVTDPGVFVVEPLSIDPGGLTQNPLPAELAAIYPNICYLYRSSIRSLADTYAIQSYVADVLIFCTPDGAMHAYTSYSPSYLPGIPSDTWVESEAGIECPDCGVCNRGTDQVARIWVDIYANCPLCDIDDFLVIDNIQVGPCIEDNLFSIRFYWTGYFKCSGSPYTGTGTMCDTGTGTGTGTATSSGSTTGTGTGVGTGSSTATVIPESTGTATGTFAGTGTPVGTGSGTGTGTVVGTGTEVGTASATATIIPEEGP